MKTNYLFLIMFLSACGQIEKQTISENCTVTKAGGVSTIFCPDGTKSEISDGQDGHSAVTEIISATSSQCSDGGSVILIAIDTNNNEELDLNDSNIQSSVVCNGLQGPQGPQAATAPFTPVDIIRPCGANSSPWKEVLLCLNNGNLLASFSDTQSGYNTRFSLISSGSYVDTDSSGCQFNISLSPDGSSIVSWNAGKNKYSSWPSDSATCPNNI